MLEAISWNQYLFTLGVVLVVYYACIGWIYYRSAVGDFLGNARFSSARDQTKDMQKQKESRASSPTQIDSKPK